MNVLCELNKEFFNWKDCVLLLEELFVVGLEFLFIEYCHVTEQGSLVEEIEIHVGFLFFYIGTRLLQLLQLLLGGCRVGFLDGLFNFNLLLRFNLLSRFR